MHHIARCILAFPAKSTISVHVIVMPIAWYGYVVASVDISAYMSVPGAGVPVSLPKILGRSK